MTDRIVSASGAATEAYLEVRGLWKAFGQFVALKDINLDIGRGEFVCFLGPSGCGKTTLLRAIAGLDPQTRGTIRQGGKDISTLPASRRDYGIVFQSYALFPNLTVEKNIAFGLENVGRPRSEIRARVAELLALVGLPEQGPKYPAQLSGGQQQRIALARAIAISPGLLLLDEPLSALDAKVRVHLRHEIKSLQRKLGVTTIMVTHDQEEALSMADRIVVMNHGVIDQVGTPTAVYRHPATLFVADFVGETNKFDASVADGTVTASGLRLEARTEGFVPGAKTRVAIRPEDILPLAPGADPRSNLFEVQVDEMEFLGSHWRGHLRMGGAMDMVANFSMDAVRRLGIDKGRTLPVEIPPERVLLFPADSAP